MMTFGAMSYVQDNLEPVTTRAETDTIGIRYQATSSEDAAD
jgi:hypothetical protein